jgi:hypothetical protein
MEVLGVNQASVLHIFTYILKGYHGVFTGLGNLLEKKSTKLATSYWAPRFWPHVCAQNLPGVL